jgi:hypothetical protein
LPEADPPMIDDQAGEGVGAAVSKETGWQLSPCE